MSNSHHGSAHAKRRAFEARRKMRAISCGIVILSSSGCGSDPAEDSSSVVEACSARFLSYNGRCGDGASALAYLEAVSADDFEQWKSTRCLSLAEPQLALDYFNNSDLALGRGLRMTECTNGVIAAYVSNFGVAGQTISSGVHAMFNDASPIAVAMDYVPARGPGYEVQFHIYGNGGPVESLEFDAEGPKLSPFACTVCHGGRYEPATGLVRDATFLPLLKEALFFPFVLEPVQEETLRRMNQLIRNIAPTPGIRMLIDAAYPAGIGELGATYQKGGVPPAWQSESMLYLGLVQPYCIACHSAHVTRPFDASANVFAADFQYACGAAAPMPQAQEMRRHLNDDPLARSLLGCK